MSWSTRSAISAAAFSVKVRARISSGRARLLAIRWAMRRVSTVVLPVPAPAMMSSGPSPWQTASVWAGDSPSKILSSAVASTPSPMCGEYVTAPWPGQDRLAFPKSHAGPLPPMVQTWAMKRIPAVTLLFALHLAALSPAGTTGLARQWYRASFGAAIGASGLHAVDLDGDGRLEIVAAAAPAGSLAADYWYVVSRDGAGYSQSWVSPRHPDPITRLEVAQMDGDGALEVLVATGAQILVYDGAGRQLQQTLPAAGPIRALRVADLDLDGAPELVFTSADDLFVLDPATGALRFQGAGLGGRDLAVGNVDGDPAREIVVATGVGVGFVVDGATHAVEWTNPTGFGDLVRTADLDGGGGDEIVAGFPWGIVVYQGGSFTPAYTVPVDHLAALRIADVEGDGPREIVYGDGQWSRLHVLDGSSGAEKWAIANPDPGVTDIALGDVDGEPGAEILWGAGDSGDAPDHLHVADAVSRSLEWRSPEGGGPFFGLEIADLDGDGAPELAFGASAAEDGQSAFFVHDVATGQPKFEIRVPGPPGLARVRSADVDGDPQRELFLTMGGASGGVLLCYDSVTRTEQWRADLGTGHTFASLQVADLDGDGRLELVAGAKVEHAGSPGAYVHAYDAATGVLLWQSPLLHQGFATLSLLRVADVAGDSRPEILVAGWGDRLWMLDATGQPTAPLQTAGLELSALDTPDRDRDGQAEIVVGTLAGDLLVLDPVTGAVAETVGTFDSPIHGLAVADVDTDGALDYVFVRDGRLRVVYEPGGPEHELGELLGSAAGAHDSLLVRDLAGGFRLTLAVNAGAPGLMVLVTDRYDPYALITSPAPGSTVTGVITLSAHAADDLAVARVEFYADDVLLGVDYAPPYELQWDTARQGEGNRTLVVAAADTAGHVWTSSPVTVTVEVPGGARTAVYDPALRAPRCSGVGSSCDSGVLLAGRGTVGPEANAPNTLHRSCTDGSAGTYHFDESNDRLRVATLDGTPFAPGKTVRVEATVWAWAGYTSDKLDLYRAADAGASVWIHIATLTPRAAGAQTLTATYTLPAGTLQAVRARFRYVGAASPCGAGVFNDHDDLAFGVRATAGARSDR